MDKTLHQTKQWASSPVIVLTILPSPAKTANPRYLSASLCDLRTETDTEVVSIPQEISPFSIP